MIAFDLRTLSPLSCLDVLLHSHLAADRTDTDDWVSFTEHVLKQAGSKIIRLPGNARKYDIIISSFAIGNNSQLQVICGSYESAHPERLGYI